VIAEEQRHHAEREVEGAEDRRAARLPTPFAAEQQVDRIAVAEEEATTMGQAIVAIGIVDARHHHRIDLQRDRAVRPDAP
jgi:hypothetical protein